MQHVSQAIETKIFQATNTRPCRIKAFCARGSVTINYPYYGCQEQNHIIAVDQLISKFLRQDRKMYGTPINGNPWAKRRTVGQLRNGHYVHVFGHEG